MRPVTLQLLVKQTEVCSENSRSLLFISGKFQVFTPRRSNTYRSGPTLASMS